MSPQPPAARTSDQAQVWQRNARHWTRIGPPLRPCEADLVALKDTLAERGPGALSAALLGVTPEIAGVEWPGGTQLVALDHSHAMIQTVWSGAAAESAFAVCADWRQLPVGAGAFDVMAGDGSFNVLARYGDYGRVASEIHRALRANGRLAIRFFMRPDRAEPVDAVLDDLVSGRVGNFHVFKWRLAMAVHGDDGDGVAVADIWRAWNRAVAAPDQLADRIGLPREVVATIDSYRDSPTRYTFPTRDQIRSTFAPGFRELSCHVPTYELGERCPSFVFERR